MALTKKEFEETFGGDLDGVNVPELIKKKLPEMEHPGPEIDPADIRYSINAKSVEIYVINRVSKVDCPEK